MLTKFKWIQISIEMIQHFSCQQSRSTNKRACIQNFQKNQYSSFIFSCSSILMYISFCIQTHICLLPTFRLRAGRKVWLCHAFWANNSTPFNRMMEIYGKKPVSFRQRKLSTHWNRKMDSCHSFLIASVAVRKLRNIIHGVVYINDAHVLTYVREHIMFISYQQKTEVDVPACEFGKIIFLPFAGFISFSHFL